jgi:hypothetical protein
MIKGERKIMSKLNFNFNYTIHRIFYSKQLISLKWFFILDINDYWSNESIYKLDEVLQNLGDELDSIMVS